MPKFFNMLFNKGGKMAECPVCGVDVNLPEGTIESELIECPDCGTELEVESVNPFVLKEAPQEEEDWGE